MGSYTGLKEGLNANSNALMNYAVNGDCRGIYKEVFDEGSRLEDKDMHGWTALRYAVRNEQFEAVKYLVGLGAEIDATSDTGRTALISAAGDPGEKSRNGPIVAAVGRESSLPRWSRT